MSGHAVGCARLCFARNGWVYSRADDMRHALAGAGVPRWSQQTSRCAAVCTRACQGPGLAARHEQRSSSSCITHQLCDTLPGDTPRSLAPTPAACTGCCSKHAKRKSVPSTITTTQQPQSQRCSCTERLSMPRAPMGHTFCCQQCQTRWTGSLRLRKGSPAKQAEARHPEARRQAHLAQKMCTAVSDGRRGARAAHVSRRCARRERCFQAVDARRPARRSCRVGAVTVEHKHMLGQTVDARPARSTCRAGAIAIGASIGGATLQNRRCAAWKS
jgi:hypothetical protein